MSPLNAFAETQVRYLYASAETATAEHRYLKVTSKLSMQKVFEVIAVEAVSERTWEQPGAMVVEFNYPIKIGVYRKILKEQSQGSLATLQEMFDVPFDQLILPFEEVPEGDHHE